MENRTTEDAFLTDLAMLQELFSGPEEGIQSHAHAQSLHQHSGCRRARRTYTPHREAVQALKREIETLGEQLRELRQAKELQDSGARNSRVNWRQLAVTMRIARQDAQDATRILKRRRAKCAQVVEHVKRLVAKQRAMLFISPTVPRVFLDDETRVLSTLKADLNTRHDQLNAFLNRSRIQTLALRRLSSPSIRDVDLWTPFVQHEGAGVKFEETQVIPFDVKLIQKAVASCVYMNAIMGPSNLVSDQIRRNRQPRNLSLITATIDQLSGGREFDGRMILRVIVDDRDIVLLWEHAFYWQANEDIPTSAHCVLVRDSGFALLTPCQVFDDHAAIVHVSESISMNAVDGSALKPRDQRVRRIARSCQNWCDVYIQSVENQLMESKIG